MDIPQLVIGAEGGTRSFVFALPFEDFTDSYSNNISVPSEGGKYRTHPPTRIWEGGQIDDLTITLDLYAGITDTLKTPQELLRCVEEIQSMALGKQGARNLPRHVWIRIGANGNYWFVRRGLIKSVRHTFGPPWIKGYPQHVILELVLTADYSRQGTAIQDAKLPRHPWKFDKVWG